MTFHVLVVCSANVCRSPLIAVALERVFLIEGILDQVEVLSVGTRAVPGQPACSAMVALARSTGLLPKDRPPHRARLLTDALVAQADVVLTTDRLVRSLVIRRSGSGVADRSFTLREAAELASAANQRVVRVRDGAGLDVEERLGLVTTAMNECRGFTELPRMDRVLSLSRPWRPMKVSRQDIPDAHDTPEVSHRLVQRLILGNAVLVARAMASGARVVSR